MSQITQIVTNQSLAVEFASDPINVLNFISGSIWLKWVGNDGTTGTANIQGTNSIAPPSSLSSTDWNNIGDDEGFATITLSLDSQVWEITSMGYTYLRLHYYPGNATMGVADVILTLKDFT